VSLLVPLGLVLLLLEMRDHVLPEEADGVHRILVGRGWADLDGQHELFHTDGLIALRHPDAGVGVPMQ